MQGYIAQSFACLTTYLGLANFNPSSATTFTDIDHEIVSMIILSLLLIQEVQLSVSGERMYTNTG